MHELLADLKYSARGLRKNPGFAVVAVLTLALGVGANSAIFSVVNAVVFRPLPYGEPERLVAVASQFPNMDFDRFWLSPPEYLELGEWSRTLERIGGYRTGLASVGAPEQPLRVTSAMATASLFPTLGVAPHLGRTYTAEEDLPNAAPVVVLSHDLWRSAFGSERGAVGRTVAVDGIESEIVGVMPPGFDVDDAGVELWVPAGLDPAERTENRGSHYLNVVGRLAPGETVESARAEIGSLIARWQREFGSGHAPHPEKHPIILEPLQAERVGAVRKALFVLLGSVGFVLLIACANVANLQLARAEARQGEIAVRSALGAGRGRLVRQFLTEAVFYAVLGGAAGLALAVAATRLLLATSPDSVPRAGEIGLDSTVLLFTLGVSLLTGLLFGLAPLLNLGGRTANAALRQGGTRTTAARGRQRLRRLLVVSETALAVVLVVGAGLMLRSFAALQRVDAGFDPEGILTFGLYLPESAYPEPPDQVAFFRRLEAEVAALPGVEGVAAMAGLPPQRNVNANDMEIEGYAFVPDTGMPIPNADYWQFATTGYLETMGIELASGRDFRTADDAAAPPVVLINETFARLFYPGQEPLGRRIRPGWNPDEMPWFTIVGVVRDVKQGGLNQPAGGEVYFHYPQGEMLWVPRSMNLVVKTAGAPLAMLAPVRAAIAALDPRLPLAAPRAMEDVVAASIARPRFLTLLLAVFAAVALALAAVGTYGVMSYAVSQRRHEIGVRLALGADARGVLALVLGQGFSVAAVGLVLGVAGAFALSRLLASILFEVQATDPVAFAAAPTLLGAVALAACWLPARRASRVDSMTVLRQE